MDGWMDGCEMGTCHGKGKEGKEGKEEELGA